MRVLHKVGAEFAITVHGCSLFVALFQPLFKLQRYNMLVKLGILFQFLLAYACRCHFFDFGHFGRLLMFRIDCSGRIEVSLLR